MSFWYLFKYEEKTPHLSTLHKRIIEELPDKTENTYILITCLAGLLARVAYVDLDIQDKEEKVMQEILQRRTTLTSSEAQWVTRLALEEIKELVGVENREYCNALNELLTTDQKQMILLSLFEIAAGDEIVDSAEVDQIRNISKALLLEHHHFLAAKATIIESLGALKS